MSVCSGEQRTRLNFRSEPPFSIGAIFTLSTSKRGKYIRVRRRSRSVLMGSDVDVAMNALGFSAGADNTTEQLTSGSNLCTRPQNCVLQNRVLSDAAIFSSYRASA